MAENKKLITPKGIAVYPRLNVPDTKFDVDGSFTVKLRLSPEDAEPVIKIITEVAEANYKERLKTTKKGKNLKRADMPFKDAVDKEGNETGEIEFNFKMNHIVRPKGKEEFTQAPALFDATGAKMDKSVKIFGGSEIKVAYSIYGWESPLLGAGVSLRLRAVQVIKLVQGGDAKSFGFEAEEGEFESADVVSSASAEGEDDF